MNGADDISSILKDRDRILMAAWMLPNEGELTETQRRLAMDNFSQYLRNNKITHADVGRQLGSPKATTITDLTKGVFRANADEQIRKLNMWVEQHARAKAAALTDKFVTTKVAKTMLDSARLVRENRTMGLLVGPTGIGKSRCCQAIHETYVGSIYIRIMDGYHTGRGLRAAIAECVGVRARPTTRHHIERARTPMERVVDALANSGRLIIIDEAHQLNDSALELLRDIHDTTGCPILLVATKELHDRIVTGRTDDAGQLYSRFDIVQNLAEGLDHYNGGKPLFTVDEIKALFQQVPIRLSSDATKYLQDVANQLGHGSLRRCRVLLQGAVRRARKRLGIEDGHEVTVASEDLEWVERHLRRVSGEQSGITERKRRAVVGAAV